MPIPVLPFARSANCDAGTPVRRCWPWVRDDDAAGAECSGYSPWEAARL